MEYQYAPTIQVSQYPREIEEILETMGMEALLITDETRVCDFDPSPEDVKNLLLYLGVPVAASDLLYVVAERLRKLSVS